MFQSLEDAERYIVDEEIAADPRTVSTGTAFCITPLVSHEALARARLARDVLLQRFPQLAPQIEPWIDLSGVASLFNDSRGEYLAQRLEHAPELEDVRVRVGLMHPDRGLIDALLGEVESLYTNVPAGGGAALAVASAAAAHRSRAG